MKKDKLEIKKDKTYRTYTLLFCAISFIIFAIFIIENKGFIWERDGFRQHYVFLYDFNQMIRNLFDNGFQMLSWNMGLGLDIIGQYSYYVLGDPFFYISLLFPMEHLKTAYSILIIIRMYCVGLAFIAYCKHQKKEKINTVIGAILYTFCGFTLYAGIRHPYFTNAAILLPLNLIGIEKLLKENKKTFFIFIIFLTAISNYYFFYMITIINIIYAVFKYLCEYNKGLKDFGKKLLTAGICYIIGISMAAIILLPTAYAFLNSARTSWEQARIYVSNFYKYFFMGLISMRFTNWTIISMSSIIILMIPILLTKLKQKEEKTYLFIFITTTIMLLSPFIASMMNGFSFPNNRWIFAYSFILSYIVTMCFEKDLKYTKKQKILMTTTVLIYCLIGVVVTKLKIKSNLDFYASMGISILILTIILINNSKIKPMRFIQKYSNYMIICLVIFNIWIISFALYSSKGKGYVTEFLDNDYFEYYYSTANGKIENFKEAIEFIKENDKTFYRIATYDNFNQNLSLMYDYLSIQTFVSIGNGNIYELSAGIEDNCYSTTRCVNGMDRRTKITTLLGTKYYICSKKYTAHVPYGYQVYKEFENTMVYINQYFISPGIIYDNYILSDEYDTLTPLQKEDALITTAVLEEDINNVKKEEKVLDKVSKEKSLNYTEKDGIIKDTQIEITENNQTIYLEIDGLEENTEIYLSIKNLKYESKTKKTDFKITAELNGVRGSEGVDDITSSAYYVKNPNFLINVGIVSEKSNNELKITFNKKGTYTFDSFEILAVKMDEYENKTRKIKESEMTDVEYGNDYISGKVNTNVNGILQITTSYSDGWRVLIDGEEAELLKVNNGFIGTIIEKGEHEVKFVYKTPYINIAIFLSILGYIFFILIAFYEKKKVDNYR